MVSGWITTIVEITREKLVGGEGLFGSFLAPILNAIV